MTETIEKTIYLAAPRDQVWAFLTEAKRLGEWFHPAQADMAEGASYTLVSQNDGDRMCWGDVQEMRPTDYMRWSFTVGPANGQMSTVEWRLSDAPGGTRLSLTHSGLPSDRDAFGLVMALDKGWHGFLSNLREKSDSDLAAAQNAA